MIDNPNSHSITPDVVRFWQKNPVQACEDILGVKLDNHQQVVLDLRWKSDSQIDILSRGCGKTFLNGVFAVLRGILIPGHRVGLIAPSFRQSKMVFAEVEKLWERSPMFQASTLKHPTRTPESCNIKYKAAPGMNGSYIEALPLGTDGSKIRGARFYDVVADEGAQIDSEVLDTVVRGFLATSADPMARVAYMQQQMERVKRGEITEDQIESPENNKLIISSTAFYQYNHLWERVKHTVKTINGEWKKARRNREDLSNFVLRGEPLNSGQIPYRVMSNGELTLTAFTYKDPSQGFMNVKTIEQAKRDMADYVFRMEYEAYFPPDAIGFFRRTDLNKCRQHNEFVCLDSPREGMIYVMGIDPARNNDNFAISVWEVDVDGGTMNLVRIFSYNKKNFQFMHREVRSIIRKFAVEYVEMDAGGGGTTIRDLLADKISCPPGDKIILEQEFDEHKGKTGERILGPLIQFSNYHWVHDTTHELLSAIQHGRVKIASEAGFTPTAAQQQMQDEMEECLIEWSSVVTEQRGDRMHWDTPSETMRKDRYSAVLVGFSAARKTLSMNQSPKRLAHGGWA